jgi:hypothetical protein
MPPSFVKNDEKQPKENAAKESEATEDEQPYVMPTMNFSNGGDS